MVILGFVKTGHTGQIEIARFRQTRRQTQRRYIRHIYILETFLPSRTRIRLRTFYAVFVHSHLLFNEFGLLVAVGAYFEMTEEIQ